MGTDHQSRDGRAKLTPTGVTVAPPAFDLLGSPVGRRWLFALLYLSEGAPIGFVWWAMPTLLRSQRVELGSITVLTTVATLPWILKFLAAPIIDASLHRGISLRRWILTCQLGMAAALLPLALLDWNAQFSLLVGVVATHALFAAVQDVGIDALAIHTVPREELGRVNGWMQAGMLGGRAGVAAGSTLIASALGDPALAVLFLAVLIALPAIVLVVAVAEPALQHAAIELRAVLRLVATRVGLAGLAIALLAGGGFEFFGISAGPRLIDLGRSESDVALFFGLFAPAGLALGALLGGIVTDRIGPLRGTGLSLAMLSLILSSIAVDDLAPVFDGAHVYWFAVAYFAIGALTASSYALFMGLSHGDFAATRFSLFMAMTNACEAWSGFVGGSFASASYGLTLMSLTAAACFAAIPLSMLWRQTPQRGTDER